MERTAKTPLTSTDRTCARIWQTAIICLTTVLGTIIVGVNLNTAHTQDATTQQIAACGHLAADAQTVCINRTFGVGPGGATP